MIGNLINCRITMLTFTKHDIDNIFNLFRCRPSSTAQCQRIPHF